MSMTSRVAPQFRNQRRGLIASLFYPPPPIYRQPQRQPQPVYRPQPIPKQSDNLGWVPVVDSKGVAQIEANVRSIQVLTDGTNQNFDLINELSAAIRELKLEKGATGSVGKQGVQGPQGPQGDQGEHSVATEINYDELAKRVLALIPPSEIQFIGKDGKVVPELTQILKAGGKIIIPSQKMQVQWPDGRVFQQEKALGKIMAIKLVKPDSIPREKE